jgi:hypothetical protein
MTSKFGVLASLVRLYVNRHWWRQCQAAQYQRYSDELVERRWRILVWMRENDISRTGYQLSCKSREPSDFVPAHLLTKP